MKKTQNKLTKNSLLVILSGIFTAALIISNILAFKLFAVGGLVLTAGILIFPVTYIINDVLSEIFGHKIAKRVILLGFIMNLVAVILYSIAIALPSPVYFAGSVAFATVLSNSIRVLIASFLAYLVGSLLNSLVLVKLKAKLEKYLMFRCVASTLVGETADSIIFLTIAFAFVMPWPALLGMIVLQIIAKTLYEVVLYPFTRTIINKIKTLKD